ncbi:hypothetical protein ACFWST_32600, partial [Streptomyces cyaneofuscatus]
MDTTSVNVSTLRSATSVAGARESTRGFLDGLVPAIAAEAADTVVLVVSELVTNALRHGGGTWTLDESFRMLTMCSGTQTGRPRSLCDEQPRRPA